VSARVAYSSQISGNHRTCNGDETVRLDIKTVEQVLQTGQLFGSGRDQKFSVILKSNGRLSRPHGQPYATWSEIRGDLLQGGDSDLVIRMVRESVSLAPFPWHNR